MNEFRYRAFISYSHADERWGDWLHRALETYRVPKALVGAPTDAGPVPRRLTPIFRDRNDLPAAGNLNSEIQAALAASQFQVVICSPRSAKSRWVNEEIKLFKKLHGPNNTLAVIVDGEPGASDVDGRSHLECFPPALRFRVDENGEVTNEPAEPIAADARREGDGRRQAISKLAAGLIGVKLDDLVQREASRRARRATAIAGGATIFAAAMFVSAIVANNARNDAQFMRGQAENLIEFMLTDLRDKLEPVGRLDVLESVGEEALDYYETQDLRKLDGDSLNRRAKALVLMGNIHQRRYDYDAALAAYEAAAETTAEQLRREPRNPDRIFDHAQSVFYIGDIAERRGDFETNERYYHQYLDLANELAEVEPDAPRSRLEVAYATSNLGVLEYGRGNFAEAAAYFTESTNRRRLLHAEAPDDRKLAATFAYALSWLALVEINLGRFESAIKNIDEQLSVYDRLLEDDPDDHSILDPMMTALRRTSSAHLFLGDQAEAERLLLHAKEIVQRLLARDRNAANSIANASVIERQLSEFAALSGDRAAEIRYAEECLALARDVFDRDSDNVGSRAIYLAALARRIDAARGSNAAAADAAALAALLDETIAAGPDRYLSQIGDAALALARFEKRRQNDEAAAAYASRGISELAARENQLGLSAKLTLAELYAEIGDVENAAALVNALDRLSLRHPAFIALKGSIETVSAR